MKEGRSKREGALLALLTGPPGPALGEICLPLKELKAQAPLGWEEAYDNGYGQTVAGSAPVILPQGDAMGIYRLALRPCRRPGDKPEEREERTGFFNDYAASGDGAMESEAQSLPYGYEIQETTEANPLPVGEAWELLQARIRELFGVEAACQGWMAISILYEVRRDGGRGRAVSEMGKHRFDLSPSFNGISVVVGGHGYGDIFTPEDYRLDLNIYDISQTTEAEVLLLLWPRIAGIAAQAAHALCVDPVFDLRLGYALERQGEDAYVTRPVWLIRGWDLNAYKGRVPFDAFDPETPRAYYRQCGGFNAFMIDAQTGEVLDMINDLGEICQRMVI